MRRLPFTQTAKNVLPVLAVAAFMLSCKGEKEAKTTTGTGGDEFHKSAAGETTRIAFEEDATQQVFAAYLKLKDALVAGNADAAAAAVEAMSRVSGLENKILAAEIEAFLEADGIEAQRVSFSRLNEKLEPVLRDHISEGAVYKQFCPMAFNNAGAFWFSDKEEIRNPYFGDMMLTCGRVADELVAR